MPRLQQGLLVGRGHQSSLLPVPGNSCAHPGLVKGCDVWGCQLALLPHFFQPSRPISFLVSDVTCRFLCRSPMEPGTRQTEVLLILVKVFVGCEERRAEGRTEEQEESGLKGQYSCQGLGGAPCLCLQGCWGDERTGPAACRVWVLVGGSHCCQAPEHGAFSLCWALCPQCSGK